MAQRSLMLQTMLFLGYVLAAGAVYARVEDWIYLDACYFIVVTLFTIGFGDLTPSTHLGRGLEFPMAAGGIVFVGLIIANIRTLVIESASKKVSLRLLEKARIRALRHPEVQDGIIKVRGFQRRDTNAPTELERRENEFNIMREIQATAIADNRRLTLGLSLSAFCILWFIGAVIFWQAEKAPGGQNWSYFEALYFTYVAQLTIGYGDLAPQTNSSKPAFVFWALIALPTLTVLIGAVGDAASDFVNWSFVWIGKHSKDLWRLSKTLTKTPHKTKELVKQACEETGDTSTEHAFSDISYIDSNHLAPRVEHEDGVEKVSARDASGDKRRHFVILRTARRILAHLEEDEPRKYTFQEWTWLLRLLGEDENHEAGHRRLGVEPQAGTSALKISPKHRKWSWLGQESPLVDVQNDGEPRWVLKRLLQSLEEEIRNVQSSHSAIASSEPENR